MNRTSIPKNGLRQTMARQRAQNRRTRRFRTLRQALNQAGFTLITAGELDVRTGRITIRMSDEVDQFPTTRIAQAHPNLQQRPKGVSDAELFASPNLAQEPVEAEKASIPAQTPSETVSDVLSEAEEAALDQGIADQAVGNAHDPANLRSKDNPFHPESLEGRQFEAQVEEQRQARERAKRDRYNAARKLKRAQAK